MGFCDITLSRRVWHTSGHLVLKFSPSDFAISLTHSSPRRTSARWVLFSKRNEDKPEPPSFPTGACALTYLHGPGTGMTNFPSFSATKFSELLLELPLASFFSTLITSFLVGFSVRQTLPVGPSIGVVAFFTSSGVRLTSSILETFSPASPDCIILSHSRSSGVAAWA